MFVFYLLAQTNDKTEDSNFSVCFAYSKEELEEKKQKFIDEISKNRECVTSLETLSKKKNPAYFIKSGLFTDTHIKNVMQLLRLKTEK